MLACTHFRSNGGFRQVKITVAHYKKKQSFTSIGMRMSVYVWRLGVFTRTKVLCMLTISGLCSTKPTVNA